MKKKSRPTIIHISKFTYVKDNNIGIVGIVLEYVLHAIKVFDEDIYNAKVHPPGSNGNKETYIIREELH